MRGLIAAVCAASFVAGAASLSGAKADDDPFLWLEGVESPDALNWVRAQNARSLAVLEKDPRFEALKEDALSILTSSDRLAVGEIHNGHVYNFWQDEKNVRGVWRRALRR